MIDLFWNIYGLLVISRWDKIHLWKQQKNTEKNIVTIKSIVRRNKNWDASSTNRHCHSYTKIKNMDNPLQYMKQCLRFQMPRTGETGKNHIIVSSKCQKINLEGTNKQNHIIVSTNKNNLERTSSEKGEEGKLADLIRSLRRRIR